MRIEASAAANPDPSRRLPPANETRANKMCAAERPACSGALRAARASKVDLKVQGRLTQLAHDFIGRPFVLEERERKKARPGHVRHPRCRTHFTLDLIEELLEKLRRWVLRAEWIDQHC